MFCPAILAASCLFLINLRLSASQPYGRYPCFVSLCLFPLSCWRGFAPVRSGCAPHSVATTLKRKPLCPGLLPRPSVSPAPFRGAPDRAPWRVLPRPRRTGVPQAPLPPLAHALAAASGSPLGRPPLLPAVCWVADCPSLVGRAPPCSASPSLVVGPYIWLLHFHGTHYSIGICNCWLCAFAIRVTRSMPMAGHTIDGSRGGAPLARPHDPALGVPTLNGTNGAAQYIIHLRPATGLTPDS